jgi:hypothetical protein
MGRRPRAAVLAVLLTVVAACALAAAGCGGDEDLTEGLGPEEILESSRDAAAQVATYHAHVTLTLDLTASGSAPPEGILGRFVGQPVTIVADGPVRRPIAEGGSAFSFDLDIQLGGFDVQATLTKVNDAVYLSVLGADFQLDLPAEQARAVELPPEPARFIAEPQEVGREEIDGVPTVHLQGEIATEAVFDYALDLFGKAPNLLGGRSLPEGAELEELRASVVDAVQESRADVWIGTEDLLPRRAAAHLVLAGSLGALLPGVDGLTLDADAEIDGFDEDVEIEAPANPIPFDPQLFSGFLG